MTMLDHGLNKNHMQLIFILFPLFQVLHYLGVPPEIEELQIPNCSLPCPLDTFFELIKNVIPSDEELKCS